MSVRSLLVAAMLSSCGCASQLPQHVQTTTKEASGEVTSGIVEAPRSERYSPAPNARYEQPFASPDNPLPMYPEALLAERLPPLSIQMRVVVGESGNVTGVIADEKPQANDAMFIKSVRSAVQKWKFTQLVQIVPDPGSSTLRDAFGAQATYPGRATALPFHQDYRFFFSQSEGKPDVEAHKASRP